VTPERAAKLALWDRFCAEHGVVEVFRYGRDGRPMLRRSAAMEAMVVETVEAVLSAAPSDAEGLIYMMHRLDGLAIE
jgi:hypothetical protein